MEVPQRKTDQDREQDSSPGENLQNRKKFKPNDKAGEQEKRNLGIVYQNLSDFHRAIEFYERHLQTAKEVGSKAGEGRAYENLGNTYQSLGDFHRAIKYHKHHLEIAKEVRDKPGEGWAYGNLGNAYDSLGNFHTAIQYHERHLQIAKEVRDKAGEGGAYGNLGITYQNLGNFHKAIEYHERHLQIAKEVGDKAGEGWAYGNLGITYRSLGDFHKAIEYHERHLQIEKEVGDKARKGRAYGNLGIAYQSLGNFHKAIEYQERHLQIAKEVRDKAGEGRAYGNLGNAYQKLGDFHKAIEYHQRDLKIAKEVEDKAGEGGAYGNLGNAYQSLGDFHKAIEYHEYHLEIVKEVQDKAGEGLAYGNLGNAYDSLGNSRKAIQYHELHLQIAKEVGDKAGEGGAYGNLGITYQSLGGFHEAIEYHERHLQIAKKLGDKAGEGGAYGNLGNTYRSLGDFLKAIKYYEHHLQIAKEVGDKAGEGRTYANEEVKKLADKEDATVDTEDNKKTLIKSGELGGEEDTWHLREAGASIKLNSEAVQQPLPFTCRCLLWNPRSLSLPIASDEILVSSVIELSHDGPPDLEYRESVEGLSFTVALLHSAPNLEEYEVVIKQLTDEENNEWKELKTENTWHGSETLTVPRWLFPFAQAVCTESRVSSFAAIWRPRSFIFTRGTTISPELTCIVPDFPDVSVQIPQSCVPVDQDFCVTIQVQEFPSSELKGEGGFVGPVLNISASQNIALIAPVTISIPLTLRKGKQELTELYTGELKILHCESLVEPHEWKDITDQLDEPPRLLDGKVLFKVRHFSRFRLIKLTRSLLQSASGFIEFVKKLCSRSRPQHARFCTCLRKTSVRGHFGLKIFCYPPSLQYDVSRQISESLVPYKDEGSSLRPVCEDEKILVSLSEAIIPQGTDEKNALQFVRFHQDKVFNTGGEVCLGSESVPGVKFFDESGELLCNMTIVLASQVPVPVTSDFEEGGESSPCSPRKRKRQSADFYMVKDGIPSDRELQELSLKLGEKWKELGSCLGFDNAAITNLNGDNEQLARKAYRMLLDWKQKEGCQATYTVLYNALCDKLVECKLLAENFCCVEVEGNVSP